MVECKKCEEEYDDYYVFRDKRFGRNKVMFCRDCYEEFMYLKMRESSNLTYSHIQGSVHVIQPVAMQSEWGI